MGEGIQQNQYYDSIIQHTCNRGKKSKIGSMKIFIKLIKLFENGQENRNHKLESLERKKMVCYDRSYRLLKVS